jgi:hypothetical protein
VRGRVDQYDAAAINFLDRYPLHRGADDLVVALERGKIFLNARSEVRKADAQTLKAEVLEHAG